MPSALHLAALGATGFVVFLLVAHAAIYLKNAFDAVRYPFGLDYGEGLVWQQALLIPGPRMYGAITDASFIVFHYPPVYHLAVRAAVLLGSRSPDGRSRSIGRMHPRGGGALRLAGRMRHQRARK